MSLDTATLSFAVLLVMFISSFALLAHWLANKEIQGLGTVAIGMASYSVGNVLIIFEVSSPSPYVPLAGEGFILLAYMWVWAGMVDFLRAKQSSYIRFARPIAVVGIMALLYQAAVPVGQVIALLDSAIFAAIFAVGLTHTLVLASGGGGGFYKGIIRRTRVGSGLMVALFLAHSFYGLFEALNLGPAAAGLSLFTNIEIMMFVIMFAFVVLIMTAERLQAELKIQEMKDPLTQALNRRAYLAVMKAVLARARRLAEPVSVIMVDIDKFKSINIKHGRHVGDEVLREFAVLVIEGRRDQDVFCRFAGEEFVLMLPGTSEEGCALVAARIRSKIEKTALSPGGVPVKLTVSMGLATARGEDLEVDGMLNLVDSRMLKDQKLSFEKIHSAS